MRTALLHLGMWSVVMLMSGPAWAEEEIYQWLTPTGTLAFGQYPPLQGSYRALTRLTAMDKLPPAELSQETRGATPPVQTGERAGRAEGTPPLVIAVPWGPATLQGADLAAADLNGAILPRARLSAANLHAASLVAADLWRATAVEANFQGVRLPNATLQGANLADTNFRGGDLHGANFQGANLQRANLTAANLHGADLRGADLFGANLQGTDFWGADLRGADLTAVSNLTPAQLAAAFLDATTRLPEQFDASPATAPSQWTVRGKVSVGNFTSF